MPRACVHLKWLFFNELHILLLLAVAWRWSSLEPPRAASTMTVDYTLVRYFKITFYLKNFTLFTAQKVHLKKMNVQEQLRETSVAISMWQELQLFSVHFLHHNQSFFTLDSIFAPLLLLFLLDGILCRYPNLCQLSEIQYQQYPSFAWSRRSGRKQYSRN